MRFTITFALALVAALGLLLTACGEEDCVPETCATLEVECGVHDDGCDGTINCGACLTPPDAHCDNNTAVNYDDGTCEEGTCVYQPTEEPCGEDVCFVEGGVAACDDGGEEPVEPGDCDINGFQAVAEYSHALEDEEDGELVVVRLFAFSAEEPPVDQLTLEWYLNYGAVFTGVGTYPIEQDTNYAMCGLCLGIDRFDAEGNFIGYFFATSGEIEVTAFGEDGEVFSGTFNDVVLSEWDPLADEAVADGEEWCIDGYSWSSILGDEPEED